MTSEIFLAIAAVLSFAALFLCVRATDSKLLCAPRRRFQRLPGEASKEGVAFITGKGDIHLAVTSKAPFALL